HYPKPSLVIGTGSGTPSQLGWFGYPGCDHSHQDECGWVNPSISSPLIHSLCHVESTQRNMCYTVTIMAKIMNEIIISNGDAH
ncbi:3272_t:CDS:1, partial [Ambispora gerdemannii]